MSGTKNEKYTAKKNIFKNIFKKNRNKLCYVDVDRADAFVLLL